MGSKTNLIVIIGAGLAATLLLAAALLPRDKGSTTSVLTEGSSSASEIGVRNSPGEAERAGQGEIDTSGRPDTNSGLAVVLQSALAETDPARRADLLRKWALSVPLKAMEQMMEQIAAFPDPDLQTEARTALMSWWAAKDPQNAGAAFQQDSNHLPGAPFGSPEWFRLLGLVTTEWAASNLPQASQWVRSMPDGQGKAEAAAQMDYQIGTTIDQLSATDPTKAEAWANSLPAGDAAGHAMVHLASTWAQIDPISAANYAAELPAGEVQNQALLAVVKVWAYSDPARASRWIDQFPDGPVREQAIEQINNAERTGR